jgi:hypothetical protein
VAILVNPLYLFLQSWERTKLQIREISSLFEIWRGSFKAVEGTVRVLMIRIDGTRSYSLAGNFGSSVLSYFVFVKWLFLLNIFTMVVVLATVVLPQAILDPSTFNETVGKIGQILVVIIQRFIIIILFLGSGGGVFVQEASRCSMIYDEGLNNRSDESALADKVLDFFQGTVRLAQQGSLILS